MEKISLRFKDWRLKALQLSGWLGILSLVAVPAAAGREPPRPAWLEFPAESYHLSVLPEENFKRAALSLLRGQGYQENLDHWPPELRGWVWMKRNEYAKALEAWAELADLPEPVNGRLKLAQGLALFKSGAEAGLVWRTVQPVLKSAASSPLLKNQSRRLLAEASLREKQYQETMGFIKTWPPAERDSPSALMISGAAKEGLGQPEAALADYEKAWEKSPPNRERIRAAAEYRRLLKTMARQKGGRFWLDLVSLHRREWRLDEALRTIDQASGSVLTEAQKTNLAAQRQLMAIYQGRYEEGCAYYLRAKGNQPRRRHGHCLERAGRYREGAAIFEALAQSGAGASQKDEDLAQAVKLRALNGDFKEAAQLAQTIASSEFQAEAAWRQGLALALDGRWLESRVFFENLAQGKYPKAAPELIRGGRYFWARALEESGGQTGRNQARRLFKELAESSGDYYQILAGGRYYGPSQPYAAPALAALMAVDFPESDNQSLAFHLWFGSLDPLIPADPAALADEFLAVAAADSSPAEFKTLAGLLTAGLWSQALEEADYLLAHNRRLGAAFQTSLARLVWGLSAQSGRYGQALRARNVLLKSMPRPQRLERAASLNLSGHPLVFSRPVLAAYRQHGLPPQLILALIKTESAWREDVVSAANAQGLMQLLPATAERIAHALGEAAPDEAELSRPELNIRYGSWYLAALTDGFEGQWPLALASYNGGPFNIARWVQQRPQAPLDVFLEIIPLVETRRYIKRVIESARLYELAYLGRGGFVDLARPVAQANGRLPSF